MNWNFPLFVPSENKTDLCWWLLKCFECSEKHYENQSIYHLLRWYNDALSAKELHVTVCINRRSLRIDALQDIIGP